MDGPAETVGPGRVDLDRHHSDVASDQRRGDRPGAGADVDDKFAGTDIRLGDEAVSEIGT
jgi:hypothetical protein